MSLLLLGIGFPLSTRNLKNGLKFIKRTFILLGHKDKRRTKRTPKRVENANKDLQYYSILSSYHAVKSTT